MAIELPDARELSDEALQVLRLRALRGLELGYTQVELADLLGVRNETISRWWTAYCADGMDCLPGGRTGRPQGIGRLLSDPQADRIKGLIDDNSPRETGPQPPPVDPPRRPRSDPQGVRHRPGGANGRQYLRAGATRARSPSAMPASKIPTRSRSGCTRSTRPSKRKQHRRMRRFCGPTRSAWRRTTSPVVGTRGKGSVQPWKCRGRTFG